MRLASRLPSASNLAALGAHLLKHGRDVFLWQGEQIVLVYMPAAKKAKVFWQQPVWAVSKIRIETANSPYGEVSYRMTGTSVELAKE
jgi:hypothetical protein